MPASLRVLLDLPHEVRYKCTAELISGLPWPPAFLQAERVVSDATGISFRAPVFHLAGHAHLAGQVQDEQEPVGGRLEAPPSLFL